jgi:hypothetical protein
VLPPAGAKRLVVTPACGNSDSIVQTSKQPENRKARHAMPADDQQLHDGLFNPMLPLVLHVCVANTSACVHFKLVICQRMGIMS